MAKNVNFELSGDEFWDHPRACLRGEGCPHVPMFADARGEGF